MRRLLSRCLLGLPLILFSLLPLARAREPEWIEVRSPNFSVITDDGERRGREVALRFEQMRVAFGALLTKAKVTLPTPLQIIAFHNAKEMRQFAPIWNGKPTDVAGLFEGTTDRSFILLDMSADNPWEVVFHEYAHQLLNGNLEAEVQPWFDEGFAEYFSTIRVDGKKSYIGMPSESDMQVLSESGLLKVTDLFRVTHDSSMYNESGTHRSVFYAQSWLVVHYLYDKQLMRNLSMYFEQVMIRRIPVETAIQQTFGMSPAEFDKQIRQYWAAHSFRYYAPPMPASIESTAFTSKPLSAVDVKVVLADAHQHSPDYQDKALGEFEEALKLQPGHAAALRGLGYAYLMKRDYARAGDYFNQSAEHDSSDPRVLYYSAVLVQREAGVDFRTDPKELAMMQKRLEKAVALDPDFADAHALLAFTHMAQADPEQALSTMLKAVALSPRNESYLFNLAQMYMAAGKYDDAILLLQRLERSSDQKLSAQATQTLSVVQGMKSAAAAGMQVRMETPWRASSESAVSEPLPEPSPVTVQAPPAKFLKGKLLAVDCSAKPKAVLTVKAGTATWSLGVKDIGDMVLIGPEGFSCSWVNRNVAVNFRPTGGRSGDVISLELQ